jgi:spoIIIJ-associated protein
MRESKETKQAPAQVRANGKADTAHLNDAALDDDDTTYDDDDAEDTEADGADDQEAGGERRRGRRPDAVPQDEQTARVLEFLSKVVTEMQMKCEVHLRHSREDEDRDIRLEITGEDAGRIIGKQGQVLGALQFLANRILNRPGEERRYVTVDAEGYRSRRDNSLAAMAKRLGKQAMTDGKIITFEPMPPRDRRVVHLALAKLEGVVTKSEGEGDSRRVQIIPVRR